MFMDLTRPRVSTSLKLVFVGIVAIASLAIGRAEAVTQDLIDDLPCCYRVTGVQDDDVLNVRSGPRHTNEKLFELRPTERNIRIARCQTIEGQSMPADWPVRRPSDHTRNVWCEIYSDRLEQTGWVNGSYLEVQPFSVLHASRQNGEESASTSAPASTPSPTGEAETRTEPQEPARDRNVSPANSLDALTPAETFGMYAMLAGVAIAGLFLLVRLFFLDGPRAWNGYGIVAGIVVLFGGIFISAIGEYHSPEQEALRRAESAEDAAAELAVMSCMNSLAERLGGRTYADPYRMGVSFGQNADRNIAYAVARYAELRAVFRENPQWRGDLYERAGAENFTMLDNAERRGRRRGQQAANRLEPQMLHMRPQFFQQELNVALVMCGEELL